MSDFATFLRLGMAHLLDPKGLDHVVFIAALTASYGLSDWRRLLVLVTAFTAGHSVTLALATLGLLRLDAALVEVLIPVTIVLTALFSIAQVHRQDRRLYHTESHRLDLVRYAFAVGFGLVHGLGFSSFLRNLLGAEERLVVPLLAFNVGLEVAQLAVLGAVLLVGAGVQKMRFPAPAWAYVVSGAALGVGMLLLVERLLGA